MSDDEHSESEFYYPEECNLNVSLQNEKFEASEFFFKPAKFLITTSIKNFKMP